MPIFSRFYHFFTPFVDKLSPSYPHYPPKKRQYQVFDQP